MLTVIEWKAVLDGMRRSWSDILAEDGTAQQTEIRIWADRIATLSTEESALRGAGQWIDRPAELMAVLGLQYDEVRNCRVLRWLLDPAGAHGFGDRYLARFLTRTIGERPERLDAAVVLTEIVRADTRADLVIEWVDQRLIIEAKIAASENNVGSSESQCTKTRRLWADDAQHFVFLTRFGTPPADPVEREHWRCVTWSELADDLEAALADPTPAHAAGRPAAEEFLRSLRSHL